MVKLDEIDRQILEHLQENGRITNNELAKRVGLTTTPTLERVKRLEREGVIKGYTAVIDRDKVGQGLTVLCNIKLSVHQMGEMVEFSKHIAGVPEILACYNTTGEYDYLLHAVVENTKAYEKFLREKLTRIPGVERIHTSIVLAVQKEMTKIKVHETNESEK
ncbi:MAG: Lrp/AsnC family transcriptional regulator [Balneolaceae bacterium]|nr:Lrp/AsnC family transcriptional regulator [Balneolaceae bacterium]MCH8548218.1 Lrp/AsnC family transcriptional regulator [Balneolaceae bacterium]